MTYPIKTLDQLNLVLKAFRKEKRLTQAAMAEKLGITQQSYAYFEANPTTATLERLFTVLRLLDVEITLAPLGTPEVALASPSSPILHVSEAPVAAYRPSEREDTGPSQPVSIEPDQKESW